jgi:hypothetical protein
MCGGRSERGEREKEISYLSESLLFSSGVPNIFTVLGTTQK